MIKISCISICASPLSIIVLLCLSLPVLHGQQNIVAIGGEAIGAGGTMSYSIGQVAYVVDSATTGLVSQGVQQPYLEIMVNTEDVEKYTSLRLFPNPSSEFTNIVLDANAGTYELSSFSYQLFDLYGHFLQSEKFRSTVNRIPTANLVAGMYILKVFHNTQPIKTFRFIKSD